MRDTVAGKDNQNVVYWWHSKFSTACQPSILFSWEGNCELDTDQLLTRQMN